MNETIHTIAARCGVSTSTVSRVLSGQSEKCRISAATTQKVLDEARRCNFVPNSIAQSLSTRRSMTIGLLLPTINNPYFSQMAHVAVGELRRSGYTTILMDTTEDPATFNAAMQTLVSRQVDGIIAAPCGQDYGLVETIVASGTPVVLIDRFFRGSELSYVTTDNYKGAVDAVRYLIAHGHRNIACINGVENATPVEERRRGYVDAMKEAGQEKYISICGNDSTIENGYLEAKLLLGRKHRPSAVFTLGNTIAIGALQAFKEEGVKIPDEMSIISFDNNEFLDILDPVLTRVSQPVDDMTLLAVKLLLGNMKQKQVDEPSHIMLPPSIIEGGSVKTIR